MHAIRLLLLTVGLIAGGNCYAEEAMVNPLALVGSWVAIDTKPNVGDFTTNMTLTQNSQFSGTVTFQGRVIMQYSGRWELQGSKITWRYETVTPKLPPELMVDTDNILSVDSTTLVLVSQLTGLRHEFSRKSQA
jgi:hypothetical protein